MIYFRSVKWKNFLSTGNTFTEIQLNKTPSCLITGHNGSGKSTMLDALCYGLFNKPFRNINKPQLINTVNEKNMVVEVEFDVNEVPYRVIRGIKPNIFEVYRNDTLIPHDAAIKDYQKKLEDIIGLNYKALTQVVVLGSARYQSFMDLSGNDRRVIIEEILDITVFSKMNAILKQKNSENELELKENDYQKEITKTQINGQKALIKNITTRSMESEHKVEQQRAVLELELDGIETKIKNIDDEISKLPEFSESEMSDTADKMQTAKFKAQDVQRNIKERTTKFNFYSKADQCHTCEQTIDSEIKRTQIEKLSAEIERFDGMKPLIAEAFKTLEDKLCSLNDLRKQHFDLSEKRREYVNDKKTTATIIENTKVSSTEGDEEALREAQHDLQELNDKHHELTKYGNECLETRHYYEICKVLLKDDGIKSKIIKQYLPVMNKLINQHLDKMGANYSFTLDEGFNEVIKSRYRDNFSYASFSEGEKMRIDLSLMFTWREIAKLKNSVSTNLLILDEIGDSSLDGDATDVLWEMIGDMKDTNVFVISHKTSNSDKFDGHFSFEKQGNFSKVVSQK